ncbi:anaerobic ribonucleoside-triphosphate reductase activating protein [Lacrimispora amygdalina]|uniref:Anaerobic ribonucleoside-triphosphate reductase-activating protein n=1 Tax=Lacrimispora amygdalina TaxID=253257 RepID=A0A3E2N603_9FIRM|nr:anaerobic ribonucleoside-triphosphate reductase activating protein [Clostridium indicum]
MKYAQIRKMDISNGEGIGISLFVQGCHFHCKNCFNSSTWDFDGGKDWTEEVRERFLALVSRAQIKRVSILGGEPLANENLIDVLDLVNEIKHSYPEKTIWLYTGYTWEEIWKSKTEKFKYFKNRVLRWEIISMCDVMVDGRYVDELRDISLAWRGSSNQRVINVKESLKQERLVLYCD